MPHSILLVEDDEDLGYMLTQYLELSGMHVHWTIHPKEVEALIPLQWHFDMGIFDVMMPQINGFDLARMVSVKYPDFPFLFLTAKDQKIDKLTGLKIGAWDYITKPCDPEELLIRMHNILMHSGRGIQRDQVINIGTYTLSRQDLLLSHAQGNYRLTEREAELLFFLWQNNGKLVGRERIMQEIWGNVDFFTGRSMDVFISRLRKYLALDPHLSIDSVRGVGYDIRLGIIDN